MSDDNKQVKVKDFWGSKKGSLPMGILTIAMGGVGLFNGLNQENPFLLLIATLFGVYGSVNLKRYLASKGSDQ
jgi:uncharacterized membrane protein HdeD (DUF308 family)